MLTGSPRPIGCLNLQVIFRKRGTNYRVLLRKMTCKDKASYGSLPPCITYRNSRYFVLSRRFVRRDNGAPRCTQHRVHVYYIYISDGEVYIIYIYILYIYQVTKHLDVLSTLYTYIIYTSDDEVYITHIHQMTKHLDIQSTVYTCIMYYIIHMYYVLHNTHVLCIT